MYITRKKPLYVITFIATLILLIGLPCSSFAADDITCQYLTGTNVGWNNYTVRSSPIYSNLTTSDSGYMRVQGNADDSVVAVYYDSDYKLISRKTIPTELPYFGGFYESDSNYYIFTGQKNPDESDSVEVFRLTKYDKSWNRINSCSLYGANTFYPFEAGSCSMTMTGKFMLIRTCHTMYDDGDGKHHQANVTIEIDTDSMTVTDSFYKVGYMTRGYSSHSFMQFIKIENNKIVAVDHGDAYPRSIALFIYPSDVTTGSFQSTDVFWKDVLPIPGKTGNNTTGSSIGALQISDSSYLIAGNTVFKDSDDEALLGTSVRNAFVASVDKSTKAVTMHWLTDQGEGDYTATTPHMVKVADNKYMVLWGIGYDVNYTLVDGNGNKLGKTYSFEGRLSDCIPLVSGGNVIWYTWKNSEEIFYSIPVNDPANPRIVKTEYGHDFHWSGTSNGLATFTCSKCSETTSGKVPTGFDAFWAKTEGSYYYGYTKMDLDISENACFYISGLTYSANSDVTYDEIVVETTDENAVITRSSNTLGNIAFSGAGSFTVTMYPKYNPDLKKTYTMNVSKPLQSVSLKADPVSPQKYGSAVTLTATPDGGERTITYRFIVTDQSGKESTIKEGTDTTCSWTPAGAGTYKLRVEAVDSADTSITRTSDDLAYTIEKADHPSVMPSASYSVPYSTDKLANSILNTDKWAFDQSDIGTDLSVGVEQSFTAHYIGSDADNYDNIEAVVKITRSSCNHDGGTVTEGAAEATCTEEGATGNVRCALCGELIEESRPIGIDTSNHVHISVLPGKAATKTEDGLTDGLVCDDCGAVIEEQSVIPMITDVSPSIIVSTPSEIVDLAAVKLSKPKAAKKSVTVKWKKVSKKNQKKIKGFEIQVAADSGFTNIVKSTTAGKKKTSKKINGLQSKKTYWVRVRTYKNASDGKHVSRWKVKKVKIK